MGYPVTEEAAEYLTRWPPRARGLFQDLLEDARSDLQRELILRATAAGHTPAEVHAFADELRPLSDEHAYQRCSLEDGAPKDYTVSQLLRAEADPLFAFELMGGIIEPSEDQGPSGASRSGSKPVELAPAPDNLAAGLAKKKKAPFDSQSRGAPTPRSPSQALISRSAGPSKDAPERERFAGKSPGRKPPVLGLCWKEHDVDVAGGLSMADA